MKKNHFQIAVLGSGFGGSLMAMVAHQLGFSTVMVERGRHPRFAIGESSTPLANLLLEEISRDYDLPFLRPLCKWGAWQKQFPHIGCGLKRGFTFYQHKFSKLFATDAKRRGQLLVGASPNETIADTHWYRPDFDWHLAQQAEKMGVAYWDEAEITGIKEQRGKVQFECKRHGRLTAFYADFVIDATGPRGCLFRALNLREKRFKTMPRTQGLFSHFRDVSELPANFSMAGQIPPYPPEQAAVHHVFPGGWIWVLKFNNGITSAGVATTDAIAHELNFSEGEAAWQRLLERLPSVKEIFREAKAILPFVHSPRLSFRSEVAAGARWALLPSAAAFVDPLLSTGFPLTLLGVTRLGSLLRSHWRQKSFAAELENYSCLTMREVDAAARLVGTLYANMDRFEVFKELSLLYFAAASFSETARRLGKTDLANSFLLCRHPVFGRKVREFCIAAKKRLSTREKRKLCRDIHAAIEPFDVAGLNDGSRDPWYPALASDMLHGSTKVQASRQEIFAMLERCGLTTA